MHRIAPKIVKSQEARLRRVRFLTAVCAAVQCFVGCHRAVTPAVAPSISGRIGSPGRAHSAAGKSVYTGNLALAGFRPSARLFVNGPTDIKRVALTFDA